MTEKLQKKYNVHEKHGKDVAIQHILELAICFLTLGSIKPENEEKPKTKDK